MLNTRNTFTTYLSEIHFNIIPIGKLHKLYQFHIFSCSLLCCVTTTSSATTFTCKLHAKFHSYILKYFCFLNRSTISTAVFFVSGKGCPCACHKAIGGRGSVAPFILSLGSRCRRAVSFTHRPLCPRGKILQDPLECESVPWLLTVIKLEKLRTLGLSKLNMKFQNTTSKEINHFKVKHEDFRKLQILA
jgi:hypothetical protein